MSTDRLTAACRSCGAPVIWAITPAGKRMPLDEATVTTGTRFVLPQRSQMCSPAQGDDPGHASHFATCPQADEWRKR